MKQILKYGLGYLLTAALPASFIACSSEETFAELPSASYPASVVINIPAEVQPLVYTDNLGASVLPLVRGERIPLGYTIAPDNVTFKDVVWTSSNEAVASVDEAGNLTAVSGDGTGYSVIQVVPEAYYSGSNIASVLKVVVVNTLVETTSLTLSAPADEVYAGETLQFSLTIAPADATYKTVRWSSSDETVAKVDANGLVTGQMSSGNGAQATITATSLDGANITASKVITVNQIIQPEDITINQEYALAGGYLCAIADKKVTLNYTTVPQDCTKSLIEWESSDGTIATVQGGVVTFNQNGVFGDVTITATCPETGEADAITLRLEAGLIRELFHDPNNYGWYNAAQSGNGTSSSHVWSYGKVTVTTYKQGADAQRGDFRSWEPKTWLHAGNYPIIAIRMQDVLDMYPGVTGRNITLDASGNCDGQNYSGGLNGNNNKWLHDYKCEDGSHVFIYSLTEQSWATGGLLPTSSVATFTTFQFKYADIKTLTSQVTYDVYWVQTFKTLADVQAYIASEGLTYEVIK